MSLKSKLAPVALLLTGVLHLLPASGVLGSEVLESLYGVAVTEPNLELLMRHRAVLFGALGTLLVAAAFHAPLRPAAFLTGFASAGAFVALAMTADGINAELDRVVAADVVALVCLAVGLFASPIPEARPRSPGIPG